MNKEASIFDRNPQEASGASFSHCCCFDPQVRHVPISVWSDPMACVFTCHMPLSMCVFAVWCGRGRYSYLLCSLPGIFSWISHTALNIISSETSLSPYVRGLSGGHCHPSITFAFSPHSLSQSFPDHSVRSPRQHHISHFHFLHKIHH